MNAEQLIPNQLRNWRFILLVERLKIPIAEMKGWAKNRETVTSTYDDPRLLEHVIANGNNYGVATDTDRFVVAADTKEVEKAVEERLPKTFTVLSPRHKIKHFYFYGALTKAIECKPTSQGDPCADVKFGNAYVLGPGSKFENYGEYLICDNLPIATITEDQLIAAIDEFIKVKKKPKLSKEMTVLLNKNPELDFPITKIIPNIDAFMQTGNNLIGPHPTHGSTTGSNFHVETEKNLWKCFRTGHGGGGPLELLAVLHGIIECEDAGKGSLRGEKFKQTLAKAQELGLVTKKFCLNKEGESKFWCLKANGRVEINIDVILKELKELFIFKTPTDIEDVYYYDNGVYVYAEHKVKSLVETWLGEHGTTYIVTEVLNHIRRSSYIEREEFNRYQGLIPVQNGLLNLKTLKLYPFDPQQIFTFKINATYNPDAQGPKWLKFVSEILLPEDTKTLQEIMGYTLLPTMPKHKIFWFHGTGRNGKGRITATLEEILGKQNCAFLGLEEFTEDRRFSLYGLYGRLLNVASEPSVVRNLQTPTLKRITGEDSLDAEVKCKQRRVNFKNVAKVIVLGNRFPKVNDTTLAFRDRTEFLKFPFSFTGANQIDNIERTWLDDPQEVSGILNWMLEGLHRLGMQGDFTRSKSQEETTLEFKRVSDSIQAFLEEQCNLGDGNKETSRPVAFDAYKEYCDSIGITNETEKAFTKKLRDTPKIKDAWGRENNKVVRVWKGLEVRPFATLATDATPFYNSNKQPIQIPLPKEYQKGIASVASVAVPPRNDDRLEESLGHKPVEPDSTLVGLIPCPECRAKGKPMFFGSDGDLRTHMSAFHYSEDHGS